MIGLRAAWSRAQQTPDPAGLLYLRGNNRERLRLLAKLCLILAEGQPGGTFFLGSHMAADVLGMPHKGIRRGLLQLERQGVIRELWKGRIEGDGKRMATVYVFIGFTLVAE